MSSLIKLRIFLFLLFGLLGPGSFVFGQPVTWKIDPEHFSIVFEVDHIGYQSQLGLFLEGSGEFDFDPDTFEFFSTTTIPLKIPEDSSVKIPLKVSEL